MFHNTHLYFAKQLYKSNDPVLLVGSFLPDLAITKIIKWEGGLHGLESDTQFTSFVHENFPKYFELADGVHAHNILDNFTHTKYIVEPGFAFQNNTEITAMVKEYYGLKKEQARGKAHNFIESAVDILLLQEYPAVQDQLKNVVKQINQKQLAVILGSYFDINSDQFSVALTNFFTLFTKYDFSNQDNWIVFWSDLEKLLELDNIGDQRRRRLLNISIDIVRDRYTDFLDYSLSHGR